jgi:DDE superfamily endonuclease
MLEYDSGMQYEFLPPYSPDYNPIELAFSAMKYKLRRDGDYVRMAMTDLLDDELQGTLLVPLYSITPADAFGWFRHCGYI